MSSEIIASATFNRVGWVTTGNTHVILSFLFIFLQQHDSNAENKQIVLILYKHAKENDKQYISEN